MPIHTVYTVMTLSFTRHRKLLTNWDNRILDLQYKDNLSFECNRTSFRAEDRT